MNSAETVRRKKSQNNITDFPKWKAVSADGGLNTSFPYPRLRKTLQVCYTHTKRKKQQKKTST